MRHSTMSWLGLTLTVLLLTGCASGRYVSTLKPAGELDLRLGNTSFHLLSVEYEKKGGGAEGLLELNRTLVAQTAKELYPQLFSEEWTALPLQIRVTAAREFPFSVGPILSALTIGIIPIPSVMETIDFSVKTTLRGAEGENLANQAVDFSTEQVVWVSLLGPLGALPIPGESDLPRVSVFLFIPLTADTNKEMLDKTNKYSTACVVEAIVKALRQADPEKLALATRARKAGLQEVIVDGRPRWCVLAPTFSKGIEMQEQADLFAALFYQEYPTQNSQLLESVIVARRSSDGHWQPVTGYLHSATRLTSVSVLLQDGQPAQTVLRQVEEPPLEDFLTVRIDSGPAGAKELRWNNGILLEAKNRTLPRLLREKRGDELLELATRIEKSILDLNEAAERAKDRAQGMVEKGVGDPEPERELAILCRQRIEVFKPILAALKQEVAAR